MSAPGGRTGVSGGAFAEQGVEAVLADGIVVSNMNRLLKNNTGYDQLISLAEDASAAEKRRRTPWRTSK